ncbi:MAG TPA: helix-turn-helix transcriptional regulator [Mucilaginibacter sp.]|nr:helix-turn-helix transcriptional regulator [Mucilaginibacter sp.]
MENPNVQRIPTNPQTLGEHIRKVRIERGMLQKAVAQILNVDEDSITAWENGRSQPQVRFCPKILAFLQYNPFSHDLGTVSGRLRHVRLSMGYSVKLFAPLLTVDPDTLTKWERGKGKIPIAIQNTISNYWDSLAQFLKISYSF